MMGKRVRNDEEYGAGMTVGVFLGVFAATAFWLMLLAAMGQK